MTAGAAPSLDAYLREFARHGGTDDGYLRQHWPRFVRTKAIFEQDWARRDARVLDVGAHWLHQALLFAQDGYRVTGADLATTLAAPNVVALAEAHGIALVPIDDLAAPAALGQLPDNAFDVVIAGEILEHLAFNPVTLWRELHRLLAEGGRIVVTTPNHYALTRRHAARWMTLLQGGGITVDEILATPTHGHHWKEYARSEVVRYFTLLSPDFALHRALYVEDAAPAPEPVVRRLARAIRRCVPPLRERLHVEIDLPRKARGVVVEPRWDRGQRAL